MSNITVRQWNDAVVEQFPFLSDVWVSERISVRRVDREILSFEPEDTDGTDASGWGSTQTVSIWDLAGRRLATVKSGYYSMGSGRRTFGESVGDVIAHLLDLGNDLGYVTRRDWDSGAEHTGSPETASLTIYQVKGFDLVSWAGKRRESAKLAVDAAAMAPGEPHNADTFRRLQTALDGVYRDFALEEVRDLHQPPGPWGCTAARIYDIIASSPRPDLRVFIEALHPDNGGKIGLWIVDAARWPWRGSDLAKIEDEPLALAALIIAGDQIRAVVRDSTRARVVPSCPGGVVRPLEGPEFISIDPLRWADHVEEIGRETIQPREYFVDLLRA